MKRFLSFFIAMVMVLSMVPAISLAAEARTVYLDPTNGLDTNDGLTEAAARKTVEGAYAALEGASAGTIVLLSTLSLTADITFPSCDIPVTITSATGAEGISSSGHIFFAGDTTLEKLTLTLTISSNAKYLSGEGHDLTIGTKVTTKSTDGSSRFCLSTHKTAGDNGSATLTVKSGNWRNIFVGGHTGTNSGNATLIMSGGNVNNLVGPTFSGKLTGDTTMIITGGTINCLMAGANESGSVTGNTDIVLSGGTITKVRLRRVVSGKSIPINGTVTVTIDGDCSKVNGILDETASGHIDKTVLLLKSGVLDITPTAKFDEVRMEIPENKTLKLVGSTIKATSVNSQGTLIFSGAASLSAAAVTGTLNCQVADTVKENHAYVTAPVGSAVTFPADTGIRGVQGVWQLSNEAFDTENFKGLVLRNTADGVVVKLYKNFSTSDANLLTPIYVDGNDAYYEVTAGSRYYCIAKPESGYDRYNIHRTFYISEAEAQTKQVVDVTPAVRSTSGWDPSTEIRMRTDEVMTKVYPSDASMWPQYAEIFTTPAFGTGRNEHMQTTQTELEDFLAGLDDEGDNMYIYILGQSAGKAFDIPLVIFTQVDLSGATTLEQAAELIREDSEKNGKLTVQYQAQIHGNEPAAGEAALGAIKRLDGAYGAGLLDTMNIYVIPRLNPYGAYKSIRYVSVNGSNVDPNRDFLRLRTAETQARMVAYNLFDPEVVLDGHEYQDALTSTSHNRKDLMLCTHWMPDYSESYKQTALDLAYAAFDQLTADGLYYSWYSDSVGGMGANTGSSNTAFRGSLHILMETWGIYGGLLNYERRVATHNSAVTGILNYLDGNAAQVKQVVHAQRKDTVEDGKTYSENDIVILDASSTDHEELQIQGKSVNLATGALTDKTYAAKVPDVIVRSRIAPTAYVIPAEAAFTEKVLALMDKHGISYTFIPAGSTLPLQQYTGTVDEAFLTEERSTYFAKGAYVFTMAQLDAEILAWLMEPDVTDASTDAGTLVQQGIISAENGAFPIYRYIRDLNEDDFVDYTITAAPVLHTTVYLDGTDGLDTNDGLSEATAVKTLEQAYAVMAQALEEGGAGSTGTLVIIGMYELGAARYHMPAAGFPVTITGATGTDGLSFTGGSGDNQRDLELHGDTTFRNLTLHTNNTTTSNRLFCNGHKVVFDEGITSTTDASSSSGNFSVYGGGFDYDHMAETVDLTIRSGTYSYVYGGGHRGSVSGQVKVVITGGRVVNSILAAYTGNVGSYRLEISNIKVGGAIYAGTYTRNTPKQIGSVLNGATLVIGKDVTVTNVYCSARAYGDVKGFSLVIADGIDLSTINVKKVYPSQNSGQLTENPTLQLMQDVPQDVTLYAGVTLDLNGHNITGNITVDGTLEVKDSQTDDYTVADGVYGKITGTVSGTVQAAPGYVALGGESFHRFTQRISGVSIRPGIAGIYYRATWQCDEVLAAQVVGFGLAISAKDMPGADFMTDGDSLYTGYSPADFVSGQEMTSAMIAGILKDGADNDARGKLPIYAVAYVVFKDGTTVIGEGVSHSLYDVMHLADQNAYSANAQALESFYATWKDPMGTWGFTNIGKQ